MKDKIISLLEDPTSFRQAISEFPMNGIATLRDRLSALRNGEFSRLCEPILLAQRL